MPSKSKSQQKLFGMVHAYQKGKLKDVSPEVKNIADDISDEDAEEFASTKHKGLPEHKKKKNEAFVTWTEWLMLREDHSELYGIREVLKNMWASAAVQPQNWGYVMEKIYNLSKQFPQHQQQLMQAWKAVESIAHIFQPLAQQQQRQGGHSDVREGERIQRQAQSFFTQAYNILMAINIDPVR